MFRRRLYREREIAKGRDQLIAKNVRVNVAFYLVLAAVVGWFNGLAPGLIGVAVAIPIGIWAGRIQGRRQWEWLASWDDKS